MPGSSVLICCTLCPSPGLCADTSIQNTSCTGLRYTRTQMQIAAAGSCSQTNTFGFDILEGGGGDQYKLIVSGTCSFTASLVVVDRNNSTSFGAGLQPAYSDQDELGNIAGDLRIYGTVSGSASGSFQLYDVDDNFVGGGSLATTGSRNATASGGISMDPATGNITGALAVSFGMGLRAANPEYSGPDDDGIIKPYIEAGASAGITMSLSGTMADPTLICTGVTITADTVVSSTPSGGVGANGYDYEAEDGEYSFSASGSGSVSGKFLPAADETVDLYTAVVCERFLNATARLLVSGGVGVGEVAARLVMGTAARCGEYPASWAGPGLMQWRRLYQTEPDLYDEMESAVRVVASVGRTGPAGVIGALQLFMGEGQIVVPSGATGGFKLTFDSGTVQTGTISCGTASAGAIKAAIESVITGFTYVRVNQYTTGDGSKQFGVSIVGPAGTFGGFAVDSSGVTGGTVIGGGSAGLGVLSSTLPFYAADKCLNGPAPIRLFLGGSGPYNGFYDFDGGALIGFGGAARIAGDPSYYCDCDSRSCTLSPSTVAASWGSVIGGVTESVIVTKTSSDPCTYEAAYVPATIGVDNNWSIKIESLASTYRLQVRDDEGTVTMEAVASCKSAPIEDAVWKVTKLVGLYATTPPMTDMTVVVG